MLRLIRRYLEAGMMADGMVSRRTEGTPLSPLLSNILLTELDWELERRDHAFCRYADDRNIYVRSQQAGERVMASITRFLADTLKLTVNAAKSAVASPWKLDQAQTALHPVATVETSLYSRQELDEGRTDGGAGISFRVQPTCAVVEQWREPPEPGFPEIIL